MGDGLMDRMIIDCTIVKDGQGRTKPPVKTVRGLIPAEQTEYDSRQILATQEVAASAAIAEQRASDLAAVCAAGRLIGGGTFAALCRLMGGTV
jgi:hypothetical protein